MQIFVFAADSLTVRTGSRTVELTAYLADPGVTAEEKRAWFRQAGGVVSKNAGDMLLYPLRGRYLWFLIDVIGASPMTCAGGRVIVTKQSFLNALPEVYRRNADFLERYLSIFSSLYLDLQAQIDRLDELLELDRAPPEQLLLFAEWMGIQVHKDFLPDAVLRGLLRQGYALARVKGTREAVRRIARLLLGTDPVIVEQWAAAGGTDAARREICRRLYGENPLGVTLLISQKPDGLLRSRLSFLLEQFKPARSPVSLVFLTDRGRLDTHCYLDHNARIIRNAPAGLDGTGGLDRNAILK